MPRTAFTEADLDRARREVRELEESYDRERAEADQLVADMRESGTDPLDDHDAFVKVDDAYKVADSTNDKLGKARQRRDRIAEHVGVPVGGPPSGNGHDPAAAGLDDGFFAQAARLLFESDTMQDLRASGVLADGSTSTFHTAPVEVASRAQTRALFKAQNVIDASPLIPPDMERFPPIEMGVRALTLFNLIDIRQTDKDSVEYTEQTVRDPNPASAAFGTALPESAYAWEVRTVPTRRKGHHVTSSRGNLDDEPALQGEFSTLLTEDLRLHLEDEMLAGLGTGETWEGVLNRPGIGSVAHGGVGFEDENRFDAVHRAITTIRLADRREPTGIAFHPVDHERMVLSKDDQGRYLAAVPTESDLRTVWGFPSIPTDAVAEGNPVAANWRRAARLWLRTGVSVEAYNQHEDYALRGLILLLAWFRGAFRVVRPGAVCEITDF